MLLAGLVKLGRLRKLKAGAVFKNGRMKLFTMRTQNMSCKQLRMMLVGNGLVSAGTTLSGKRPTAVLLLHIASRARLFSRAGPTSRT